MHALRSVLSGFIEEFVLEEIKKAAKFQLRKIESVSVREKSRRRRGKNKGKGWK